MIVVRDDVARLAMGTLNEGAWIGEVSYLALITALNPQRRERVNIRQVIARLIDRNNHDAISWESAHKWLGWDGDIPSH